MYCTQCAAHEKEIARKDALLRQGLTAIQAAFDYPPEIFELGDAEPFTMTVTGRHLAMVAAAIAAITKELEQPCAK